MLTHTHVPARVARMRPRAVITTAAAIAAAAVFAGPAQAALTPSANDSNTTLPATFTDSTDGLTLEPCSNAGCAVPGPRPDLSAPLAVPGNFHSTGEAFWWHAAADLLGGTAEFAVEAAFLLGDPAADQGSVFSRIRFRFPGLNGRYRITHPFGVNEYAANGGTRSINDTIDTGCNPTATVVCDYTAAGYGAVTSFLRPAAGFPTTPGTVSNTTGPVVGSPTGYNGVKIEKQVPVAVDPSGWQLVAEQLNLTVQAQTAGEPAAPAPFVGTSTRNVEFAARRSDEKSSTQKITVRNDGAAPLTVSSVTLTGTDKADFAVSGCTGPVAPRASCDLTVGFVAGAPVGRRQAAIEIVSDAANAATLSVALGGTVSGLPPAPTPRPQTPAQQPAATPNLAPVVPGVGPVAAPAQVVQGTVAKSLALNMLTFSRRISTARLRAQGLRVVMGLPEGTQVLRLAVYRAVKGEKSGPALFSGYRVPGRAGTYRVSLRDRTLVRKLRSGLYVLEVQAGQSRSTLGTPHRQLFRVTR